MTGSYIGGHTIINPNRPRPNKEYLNLKDDIGLLKILCEKYAEVKPNKVETDELRKTLKHVTYNEGRLEVKKGKLEPSNPLVKSALAILKRCGALITIYSKEKATILFKERENKWKLEQEEQKRKQEERKLKKSGAKRQKSAGS